MKATKEQHERVTDYLMHVSFSQIDAEEAEQDLVEYENESGEIMTLDTFIERFKIRAN